MKYTTVRLTASVARQLKRTARDRRTTQGWLVAALLEESIAKEKETAAKWEEAQQHG